MGFLVCKFCGGRSGLDRTNRCEVCEAYLCLHCLLCQRDDGHSRLARPGAARTRKWPFGTCDVHDETKFVDAGAARNHAAFCLDYYRKAGGYGVSLDGIEPPREQVGPEYPDDKPIPMSYGTAGLKAPERPDYAKRHR